MSNPHQDIEIIKPGLHYKRCEKCSRQTQHVKGKCIWHTNQINPIPTKKIANDKKTLNQILEEETQSIPQKVLDKCPECGRLKIIKNPTCYNCKIKKIKQARGDTPSWVPYVEGRIKMAKHNIERWEKQLRDYKELTKKN